MAGEIKIEWVVSLLAGLFLVGEGHPPSPLVEKTLFSPQMWKILTPPPPFWLSPLTPGAGENLRGGGFLVSLAIKASSMDHHIIMEYDYMDFCRNYILSVICMCHIQIWYSVSFWLIVICFVIWYTIVKVFSRIL